MATPQSEISARPVALGGLLEGVEQGSVVLPDFQREFVWSESEVAALVATVMFGWPAGSLLLMHGSPTFFETRAFDGVAHKSPKTAYVVLDGQQRLTALHRALRGTADVVYAVDLDLVKDNPQSAEDLEEAILVLSEAEWADRSDLSKGEGSLLAPLSALMTAADYFDWRDQAVASARENRRGEIAGRLTNAYKDFMGTVNHYQFPAVILENDLPVEPVARIFERINRGGIRLSVFDLLVARAYTPEWNLRKEWDAARRDRDWIDVYLEDDGLPVAQALALRQVGDIRRPALLELRREQIHDNWLDAVIGMEAALEFVQASGMRNPDWLPYRSLLIPLAALARDYTLEDQREILEPWLWARSLGMEYDVASSTKISSDYEMLSATINDGTTLRYSVRIDHFPDATRRQHGALWRTFLSLLLRRGAVDLLTGDELAPTPFEAGEVAVASLFARSARTDPGAPHLRVLGQVLSRRGSRRIRGISPLTPVIATARSEPRAAGWLTSQFLPDVDELQASDSEALILSRRDALATYLEAEFPTFDLLC